MQILQPTIKPLETYLKNQGWLQDNETIEGVEKPGEGNMNFTLRIITNPRSFIIKQSRDFVEKYPSVPAPPERVQREAMFYKLIGTVDALRRMMPRLIGLDTINNVMNMEDLGAGRDFTFLYQENQILNQKDLSALIRFVTTLHGSISRENTDHYISNKAMRELNHEHIFVYPYLDDNGINLDDILPGLQEVAHRAKGNTTLKKELKKLGAIYLADGDHLLHGDYFPGSWLRTNEGIQVIDPEFCFFGPVEFEIGVMIAHLKMANQPEEIIESVLLQYGAVIGFDPWLQRRFSSAEILRRILGLAQLPLAIGLERRKALVEEAVAEMIRKE